MSKKTIEEFKNIHKGERCFIMGCAPSINDMPLEYLLGETVFGCNSLWKHHVPMSYFGLTDGKVWHNHKKGILETSEKTHAPVFLHLDKVRLSKPDEHPNTVHIKETSRRRGVYWRHKRYWKHDKLWGDMAYGAHRGGTVIISLIQIAYYMGFKKVYLLGCDCNYGKVHHFDGSKADNRVTKDWHHIFQRYAQCKRHFEKDNRRIYNAGVGGDLEVFKRVSFPSLF